MFNRDEQALKDFLQDIDSLRQLDEWKDNFNLFEVLKITNFEIRHSTILAWFFDPNENHGLGETFLESFIHKVSKKIPQNKIDVFDLLLQDFYSYQIYREYKNMDIVISSYVEKTAFIIENKIWAQESPNQLKKYLGKSKIDFKDFNQILYIFLTPDGREASDPDNWISFSYSEIIELLENAKNGKNLKSDVELIINNYIEMVRKEIMKEKDERLVKICNEIYNKHKIALRLIYENVEMNNSLEHEIISGVLKELSENGKIIYNNRNKWYFFTEAMNEFLPELESENSSFNTNWVYYYWLEKINDKLHVRFELGGWNLNDDLKKRTNALIEVADKRIDEYKFKRLYHKSLKLSERNYEDSIKNATKSLIRSVLNNEEKLLEKAKKLIQ